jgi:hypothetical protein
MSQLTIHTSREAANAAQVPDHKLIEVFKRNPSRYAAVWLDIIHMPDTREVPVQYRAIVDAAILSAVKGIIDTHAFSGTYEPSWMPADKLTCDAIITATQQTGTTWLSKEDVAQGWEGSYTCKTFKTKMLSLEPTQRKGYAKALDAFSEAINKLSAKSVKSISPEQATTMLAKLDDRDLMTSWGEFIAARLGTIANREEPEAFDLDSL